MDRSLHTQTKPMFRLLIGAVLAGFSFSGMAQTPDSGSYYLHKFAQNIGKEHWKRTQNGAAWSYDVDFHFVDRGAPVGLKAVLVTTTAGEPVSLAIKGSTSRFSTINDTVTISGKQAILKVDDSVRTVNCPPLAFPVGGYSPGLVQMALIRYWKKHNMPKEVSLLPSGKVAISRQGRDTIQVDNKKIPLQRYVVSGLIWGNEIVWLDDRDNLVCLITNDAEGDKLEMMKMEYEPALPALISRAAEVGMQLFTASMKMKGTGKKTIAILGGRVVDVESGTVIENATVVIENGIIKSVGASGFVNVPAGATLILANGKTVLPGLWDMHAHFQQAEWGPAYLAAGVTTVRDCGNEFGYINAVKSAIDARKGVGPFIIKAGIVDGPGPLGLGIVRATTPEEAVKVVNMYKQNGFAQIKIYSSVKPAIVKAICEEAHRQGLTVTGHIPQGMSTQAGIDSGMDMVNHVQYVYSMMKRNTDRSVDFTDSQSVAALNFLYDHHVVIDPTVGVFEMAFRSTGDDIKLMEPNFYTLPLPLQTLFVNTGMEPVKAKAVAPIYESMLKLVKVMHDRGITVVAGTDMGFPGYSVARELELYVQSGLTPLQAIQTATITPARVMKMDVQTGSIKTGKMADLLIVDGNPLENIRDIRQVYRIIKAGDIYNPDELHAMVGFSK